MIGAIKIAEALRDLSIQHSNVADQLRQLGVGRTVNHGVGAIEYLGLELSEASKRIADGLHDIADAIRSQS